MLTIHTNHPPRGGNLVHRYKTIDNFTESIKYLVYTPKCAIIVVFDFSWATVLKGEKTGNNGKEKFGLGGKG